MSEPIDATGLMTDRGVGRFALDPAGVIGIAVHHSVSGGQFFDRSAQDQDDELSHLLMIDQYHASLSWGGFGYHLAAFPSGRWYWCGNLNGARAHVASRNHELVGLVLIGTFTTSPPPPPQLAAAAHAVALMRRTYPGRPIRPHRHWAFRQYPTSCPGDVWQEWLPALEALAQEDEEMKLVQATPSGRVYVLGESGKRWIDDQAEQHAYNVAGYGFAQIADAEADAIPDAPIATPLLRGNPSGCVYILDGRGKRYIDDPPEEAAYRAAGWTLRVMSDAQLAAIPNTA